MKRNTKRLLALLLAILLCLSLLPVTALAAGFPQQFYASINFADYTGYKSFGHVTRSSSEWMIYKETGDVAGRSIYGMEYAGGAIFTVESDDDEEWMLRVYSSDLATSRTIGRVTNSTGKNDYAIVDTAMDLSSTEPVLYGTYQSLGLVGGQPAYCSYICKISLTDGTTSDYLQIGGDLPSTDIVYAIAFDEDGTLYAIGADAGDDGGPASLYTIDLDNVQTGTFGSQVQAKKVGAITDSSGNAISTNYVQDLAFDHATNTLYWMENKGNVLYTVDATSAVATKVGYVRFDKDISQKTYSLSAFCILDGTPATSGGKHMVSVIHDEHITVTDGNDNTAAVYMLDSGESLTLNIKPDPKLGLWYVKVDGVEVEIEDPMKEMTQTIQVNGSDHVIEVASRVPINIEKNEWNWDHYQGKTASYYTQHSVYKFYDLPDRFEPDFDAPEEDYTQTLLNIDGTVIDDNERILVGNKYNVRVTHEGTEKYAPLNVTYNDVLNLEKCEEPPGRPVVYGKVGCKQSDLATTSYLQDYYKDDGNLYGTEIYDRIPVTLEWLDPDKTYDQEGYFFAKATIYAAEDLDPQLARYYDVDNGGSLTPGCQIDPNDRLRSTQVIVLPADEASLIKLQASDASGGTVSGKGVYKNGETVTVTAAVNEEAGFRFDGWQEGEIIVSTNAAYTFTASGDRTLTALFEVDEDYRVILRTDPQNGGTVTGGGSHADEPHSATVTATANPGYYFMGWYEGDEAKYEQTEYTFDVPEKGVTLTARFGIDSLALAEQTKKNLADVLGTSEFEWAMLTEAVDAYEAAESFVNNPPSGIENAKTRFDALTTYYQSVDTLNLSGQKLTNTDLAELELFTGVTELNLSGNKSVTDLTDLPNMANLETLDLSGTGITDLSSLTGLMMLETLDISDTGVTVFDALVNDDGEFVLSSLKSLTAKNLTLTSLSALAKLVDADDFITDSVTKWDFTGSTLPNTDDNKADVETIQTELGNNKFIPPTIQTDEPGGEEPGGEEPGGEEPGGPDQPGGDDEPTTPVIPPASDEDDEEGSYSVSVPASFSIRGGSITVSPRSAEKGDTITITVKPDDGYELDTLTVIDNRGREMELTGKSGGRYTFTMPASLVNVKVTFRLIETAPVNPFTDVSTGAYYYDAVLWAVANGITNGTTATAFSPDVTVTRAQMVTFLWRAHGAPRATGSNPFTDVSSSAYYYDAVLWAVEHGVTNGTTAATFGPNAPVTRAQAVTFQWRASGSPAVSGGSFSDVAANAYYSGAVTWAVANGITNGTTAATFSPDTPVSRAQAVTFLYREAAGAVG